MNILPYVSADYEFGPGQAFFLPLQPVDPHPKPSRRRRRRLRGKRLAGLITTPAIELGDLASFEFTWREEPMPRLRLLHADLRGA
ncbi:MAG: hypothetical protein INR70_43745 [Parafilimonas terrae]|nr:hypothetical protein [Parafilimonas terrae]